MDIEKKVKNNEKNMLTTTQLRLLLSNAVVIKNKIMMESNDKKLLSEKIQGEIKYLLIKHIYQCGRDSKVKEFDKIFEISNKIEEIGNSKEKFDKFYRELEEIVAYVKYYKG